VDGGASWRDLAANLKHLRPLMKCLELWMTKIGPFSWLGSFIDIFSGMEPPD
jgi:hypothetical protein